MMKWLTKQLSFYYYIIILIVLLNSVGYCILNYELFIKALVFFRTMCLFFVSFSYMMFQFMLFTHIPNEIIFRVFCFI